MKINFKNSHYFKRVLILNMCFLTKSIILINFCFGVDLDSLKLLLTPIQFEVTQNCGTERPFKNKYWDNQKAGIYVDIITGVPLFSSLHKYDSGTGWPSFYNKIDSSQLVFSIDGKLNFKRTEIKSKSSNAHLGHLFNDGPSPTGMRYCINSASLRFISYENLDSAGFHDFKILFKNINN